MSEVTLRRSSDAIEINAILNHPDVKPWVSEAGSADLDLTEFVADPANVVLMGDGGGLIFHWLEPHVYEVHTQFLPEHRGACALRTVRAALRWIFTVADAEFLLTKVPVNNVAADTLAKLIGGELIETRESDWKSVNGPVDTRIYALSRRRWSERCQRAQS